METFDITLTPGTTFVAEGNRMFIVLSVEVHLLDIAEGPVVNVKMASIGGGNWEGTAVHLFQEIKEGRLKLVE